MSLRLSALSLALLAASCAAHAGDDPIRAAIKTMKPDVNEVLVKDSAIPGLKEVQVDGTIVYTTPDGRYLIAGDMFDTQTHHNLSADARTVVNRKLLASSPASTHIRFAPAKPAYTIYVFTDASCGYCRKFHSQIADYNKLGIAVEYLAYPRNGLDSPVAQEMNSAWCAADKRKALTAIKNDQAIGQAPAGCKSPVAAQYALGRKLGIQGTPGIFAADGRQLGGYLPPDQMLAALKASAP